MTKLWREGPKKRKIGDRAPPLSQGLDPALVCSLRTVSVILGGARGQPSHPEAFLERMGFGLI